MVLTGTTASASKQLCASKTATRQTSKKGVGMAPKGPNTEHACDIQLISITVFSHVLTWLALSRESCALPLPHEHPHGRESQVSFTYLRCPSRSFLCPLVKSFGELWLALCSTDSAIKGARLMSCSQSVLTRWFPDCKPTQSVCTVE